MENIFSKGESVTTGIKLTKKPRQYTGNHMAATIKWNITVHVLSIMLVCFSLLQMHRLPGTKDTVRADFDKAISSAKTEEEKTKS